MGYYVGDFYTGRGDPGIGSFFGSLVRTGLSMAPAGGAITKIGGAVAGRLGKVVSRGRGIIMKHPVLTAGGAAGLGGLALGAGAEKMLAGGMCPKGHHISKKGKHAGACVKNRHMNPCNPKALRRASRRAHAFLRISNKLVRYYMPHKKKGRPYIKARKKK